MRLLVGGPSLPTLLMTSKRKISELTRDELYDAVWSTPVQTLAKQFGISDVAFAKRCKNQNVPRPPRGYWAKVAAGKKPRKIPLPPSSEEVLAKLVRGPAIKNVAIPESSELHPLAAQFLKALKATKPDEKGRISFQETG